MDDVLSSHQSNTTDINIQRNPYLQYGLLAAITLLAAVMRFHKLGVWSFWIDELFTISRAQTHFSDLVTIVINLPSEIFLPISVLFTEVFLKILGVSEWSARLASALIGILSIPLLYFATRKYIGAVAALITAFLLAISPWHLFWSQNARFYTSLMLFYTLAALAFFLFIEYDRPKYLLLFFVLLYFAASERLIAVFILPVIIIYQVVLWIFPLERPKGLKIRNFLLLITPILLVVIFDIIRFRVTGFSYSALVVDTFFGQQFDDPLRLLAAIGYNISLPIIVIGLVGGFYLSLNKSRIGLFFLISAVLPLILLLILNPFMFTKDRYVFMTLPSWLILAAISIQELIAQTKGSRKLLAAGVLLVLVAEAVGTNLLYYQVNNGDRLDWKTAFEIIKSNSIEGDAFVSYWPEFGPYYLGKEIIPWNDINSDTVINSGVRYWFLVDSETFWSNLKMRYWVLKHAELIEVLYLRMPEDDFNLRIYLYDPDKVRNEN